MPTPVPLSQRSWLEPLRSRPSTILSRRLPPARAAAHRPPPDRVKKRRLHLDREDALLSSGRAPFAIDPCCRALRQAAGSSMRAAGHLIGREGPHRWLVACRRTACSPRLMRCRSAGADASTLRAARTAAFGSTEAGSFALFGRKPTEEHRDHFPQNSVVRCPDALFSVHKATKRIIAALDRIWFRVAALARLRTR